VLQCSSTFAPPLLAEGDLDASLLSSLRADFSRVLPAPAFPMALLWVPPKPMVVIDHEAERD
jgi:hypothetical protein